MEQPPQPEQQPPYDIAHQRRIDEIRITATVEAHPYWMLSPDGPSLALIARHVAPSEESALARFATTGEVPEEIFAELPTIASLPGRDTLRWQDALWRYCSLHRGRPAVEDWAGHGPDRIGDVARIAASLDSTEAEAGLIQHGTARAVAANLLADGGFVGGQLYDFVVDGRFDPWHIGQLHAWLLRDHPSRRFIEQDPQLRRRQADALLAYCEDRASRHELLPVDGWHTAWVADP